MSNSVFRIHPDDSVAIALADIAAGERIAVAGTALPVVQAVQRGHKIALRAHAAGERVIKFGQPIGAATQPIAAGEHVHRHNLATLLDSDGSSGMEQQAAAAGTALSQTWMGYDRGGRAGTRNEIWILPTVGCVARTAQRIAAASATRHAGRVDGIHAFVHPHGCSQLGDDLGGTRAILAALAAHPNAGGVLLVGLGCESNQLAELVAAIPPGGPPVRTLAAQALDDELTSGIALVDELVAIAAEAKRTALPLSRLVVGLKCGGSDGLSGLTANPLLGRFAERLCASGGSAILTEIPEIFGAEHLLLARAGADVRRAGLDLVAAFKDYFRRNGEPVSENPSPGNIAGGITTLEEKSLGAVQKAGRARVVDVIGYGQPLRAAGGVTLLEAPGNDAVSSTALAAAGAGLILFTTGRGTPLGFPVPTMKVASNSALAQRKQGWIDFDAGAALDGELAALDAAFTDRIIAHVSGEATAAERNDEREIAIWKRGVTL